MRRFSVLQKIVCSSVVLMFFALGAAGASSAQDLPAFFIPSPTSGVNQVTTLSSAEKMTVTPNFLLIDPDQNPVAAMAALIPGKTVVLIRRDIKKRGTNNFTWFGKVDGYELSTVVLTVVDGIMHGHMNMAGESYSITPDDSGYFGGYLIVRNDPSRARPFDEGPLVPPALSASTIETQAITTLADDGSVIDVLMLYTQEMYNTYGPSGNNTLNTKIQHYIDLANAAYSNSGITTSLRQAQSALYTAAGAAEGVLINNALNYITTDASAIIGPLRNTYTADLVSLLRVYHDTPSCGLAWIMKPVGSYFESNAFSVVEVRPSSEANPYYCDDTTFAHELGHNMGCAHDRIYAGTSGAYPYSYGYGGVTASFLDSLPTSNPCYGSVSNPCNLRTDHEFGTIMSYLSPTITYFSTPNVSYYGVPIGISGGGDGSSNPTSSADNATTINNTRVTVANFRVAATTQYKLTTAASSGGGVSPDCPGGCWYNSGSTASLFAIPNSGYVMGSWTGDCSGSGLSPSATVLMNGAKACTANFSACADNPAKNTQNAVPYALLQSAYDDTTPGSGTRNGDTIRLLSTTLSETLNLNRAISVTLSGGWNCGFATQNSSSIIHGSLTIGNNSLAVIAEKLIVY